MNKNKDELPPNWFKRFSRNKHRGREYYYNVKTNVRTWEHPLENVAKNVVVQWLRESGAESVDGRNSSTPSVETASQCDDSVFTESSQFSWKLEEEYKKFEEILANIESTEIIDLTRSTDSALCVPANEAITQTSFVNRPLSLLDATCHGPFVSIDDEKAIQAVSMIRYQEELENRKLYENICQGPVVTPASKSFYIVIDTSIFLSQIGFLANLLSKIDEVPGQPMLVIPYVVFQELDKLKMTGDNATAALAMHAIAFIGPQLKKMPNKISGQSAMDNGIKFIEIFNASDSIINCCLQLKQQFECVMLLTNDMSLTNRAICSHIETYSKIEFEELFLRP